MEPADEWSKEFIEMLGTWDEEIDVPRGQPITETKDPFERGPFDWAGFTSSTRSSPTT